MRPPGCAARLDPCARSLALREVGTIHRSMCPRCQLVQAITLAQAARDAGAAPPKSPSRALHHMRRVTATEPLTRQDVTPRPGQPLPTQDRTLVHLVGHDRCPRSVGGRSVPDAPRSHGTVTPGHGRGLGNDTSTRKGLSHGASRAHVVVTPSGRAPSRGHGLRISLHNRPFVTDHPLFSDRSTRCFPACRALERSSVHRPLGRQPLGPGVLLLLEGRPVHRLLRGGEGGLRQLPLRRRAHLPGLPGLPQRSRRDGSASRRRDPRRAQVALCVERGTWRARAGSDPRTSDSVAPVAARPAGGGSAPSPPTR